MRITTKGQVTIPQAIRDQLGLLPHAEVEFDIVGDSAGFARSMAGGPVAMRSSRLCAERAAAG